MRKQNSVSIRLTNFNSLVCQLRSCKATLQPLNYQCKGTIGYSLKSYTRQVKEMDEKLSGNELVRLIFELRAKGWTDTEIIEHILKIVG